MGKTQLSARIRSIAICIPVWNRGDLFLASFRSLTEQLDGVKATIWLFDNGSRPFTRRLVDGLQLCAPHNLFVMHASRNMGIPYVINAFCRLVMEKSDYAEMQSPEFVMIADADALFKAPVKDMVDILRSDPSVGIVSGHDAIEHEVLGKFSRSIAGRDILVKEKRIERGLCLVMRIDELTICYPFPHHTNLDFDWEIMERNPNSIAKRNRRLFAVDHVVHLGLYDSTWSRSGVPASDEEIAEIDRSLDELGLFTADRMARREKFLRQRAAVMGTADTAEGSSAFLGETGLGCGVQAEMTPETADQVLVTGMHRSGTSLVTHILHLMGCDVGSPERLLCVDDANPSGYWERTDVLSLNQRVLARFDADAYQIGWLDPTVLETPQPSELAGEADGVVSELNRQRPWVAKDPRFCLTLPFWRQHLTEPVVVLMHRSPIEVARSLSRRDGLPIPYAVALWEKYLVEALRHTKGLRRVLVSHSDLISDPVAGARRLFADLRDVGVAGLRLPDDLEIRKIVDKNLYHHRVPPEMDSQYLNLSQFELYAALKERSALAEDTVFSLSQGASDVLRSYPTSIDLQHFVQGTDSDEDQYEQWFEELDRMLREIRKSRTWRTGSTLREIAHRLSLRGGQQETVFQQYDELMCRYRDSRTHRDK